MKADSLRCGSDRHARAPAGLRTGGFFHSHKIVSVKESLCGVANSRPMTNIGLRFSASDGIRSDISVFALTRFYVNR
jgi:hypothetical protein